MWKNIFAFLVLAALVHVGIMLKDAGLFRTVTPAFTGTCRVIDAAKGPEDLEFDPNRRLIFISANNFPENPKEVVPNGAIYTLDPAIAESTPVRVTEDLNFDFRPHGISIYSTEEMTRVFVVNHRRDGGTIEAFDWIDGKLKHVKTYRDSLLHNNHNDVAAVGLESFYVTHEQGSEVHWQKMAESYLRLGRGNVVYYDGISFAVKAKGLHYGNGIILNPDRTHVLVAEMLALRVSVYKRDPKNGDLTKTGNIPLNMGPDNLSFDENGNLWVAGHPKLFELKAHANNHSLIVPSRIVKIENTLLSAGGEQEVFIDDGRKITAASVAVPIGNRFYLGSIFTNRMLECTL